MVFKGFYWSGLVTYNKSQKFCGSNIEKFQLSKRPYKGDEETC